MARALAPELQGASPEAAAALCRVLGKACGATAARALAAFAKGAQGKPQEEAIRALGAWSEGGGLTEAADGLLEVTQGLKDPRLQILALRGYINLARSRHWRRRNRERLKVYTEALKLATRAEEKRSVLGGLGGIQDKQAVALAASCLGDKAVAEEAATAVVQIAKRLKNKTDPVVQGALAKVVELTKNPRTQKEAARLLVRKPEPKPLP